MKVYWDNLPKNVSRHPGGDEESARILGEGWSIPQLWTKTWVLMQKRVDRNGQGKMVQISLQQKKTIQAKN